VVLVVARDVSEKVDHVNLVIQGQKLEVVPKFEYIGSDFTSDNAVDGEVSDRIVNAGFA